MYIFGALGYFSRVATVGYTFDPVTSQVKTVTDGRGTTSYGFDSYDRVNSVVNPDGQTVGYSYDVLGNLKVLTTSGNTVNYAYDKLNRLDTVTSGTQLAKYNYDAVGNLLNMALADGTTESHTYDASNRLTGMITRDSLGAVLSSYDYTLDGLGNRTKVVENTGRTVNYTYDAVNQLELESMTDPTLGNRTIGYEYDPVGNRLKRNDSDAASSLTIYTYDANNRLKDATAGTKVTNYTYDNNGSTLTSSDGTNTTTYEWINDGENRLVSVTLLKAGVSSQTKYIYDASGNRVASITDGVRKNYLLDTRGLAKVLQEYDTNGQIQTKYTFGLGLIKSESGGNTRFYHIDGLGSTRLLTDGSGQVTDRYVYDAYGRLIASAGSSSNSFQFAGEQRDSTGLDYLRARYYDSDLGRFISKDAFAGRMGSPISKNPYAYANNNPINNTDPSGYFTLGEVSATEAIISTLSAITQQVITGALFGGAFNVVHQDLAIYEGSKSGFSVDEFLESTAFGAVAGPIFAKFPLAGAAFALYGVKTGIDEYNGVGQYNDGHSHKLTGAFDIIASISPFLFKEVQESLIKQIEGFLGENNVGINIRAILEMNLIARGSSQQQGSGSAGYGHINPNGYTSNCVNCAIAVDRTLAGFPETVPELTNPRSIFDLENIYGGSFEGVSSAVEIVAQLQQAGPGARGIVYGVRPSEQFDGHVFNAVNEGGNVIFIDGQKDFVVTDFSSFTDLGFLRTN